ncbi:PREDICTED: putative RING-H2 finger protein ATL69 [Populus euphratica]|uniref:RING-H2 finger protein ATL69 n=1 Tax=Populus euphratica TaxID=75702 RepID=A0AAJ6USA3_POPEU|nr:PREDICTED: putative RING-H2 finger protein ATL69 [Populus euphratica]
MSTVAPPVSASAAAGSGLGYGIAIAIGILVLISTIMLTSYACSRIKGNGNSNGSNNNDNSNDNSNNYEHGHDRHFTAGNPIEPMTVMVGLAEPIIDSYTKMVLGESRRLPKPNEGPCSICLSDYQTKDTIRCIPDCHHCFHADCIDGWLKMSATCPLCRNSPAPSKGPTPVTTPLAEVVPLAFHAR